MNLQNSKTETLIQYFLSFSIIYVIVNVILTIYGINQNSTSSEFRGDNLMTMAGFGFFLIVTNYVFYTVLQLFVKPIRWIIPITVPIILYFIICIIISTFFSYLNSYILLYSIIHTVLAIIVACISWGKEVLLARGE